MRASFKGNQGLDAGWPVMADSMMMGSNAAS